MSNTLQTFQEILNGKGLIPPEIIADGVTLQDSPVSVTLPRIVREELFPAAKACALRTADAATITATIVFFIYLIHL